MNSDGTQDSGLPPLPPVPPPPSAPSAARNEEHSENPSAARPDGGAPNPEGEARVDGQTRTDGLARTAQLPVVGQQPAPRRRMPFLATDGEARPVAASAASAASAVSTPIPTVPENAPITTSMPVLPSNFDPDLPIREAAQRLEQRLLGSPRTLRRREVAADAGVSLLSARKVWRSLGLPRVGDDEIAYTENDERALETIIGQVRNHTLSEEGALSITRSLGQFTDRMVIWQIEAIVEDLVQNQGMDDADARRHVLLLLEELIQPIEEVMVYAYRRNLAAAVQRQLVRADSALSASAAGRDGTEDDTTLPLARAVGFVDMVSFTATSRTMDERSLAKLVQGFEEICSSIITVAGGRLVKTIGDEVLYVAETPEVGAQIALALSQEFASGEQGMPRVRVGLVWGRVLSRLGDIYGATVNMAARLTAMAEPGEVLTDHLTSRVLAGDDRFVLTAHGAVELKGFGTVTPYDLSSGTGHGLTLD
ncbi:MAG: adenylate/guanylate cyclase domain-containing protein [Galactobacter sp.]